MAGSGTGGTVFGVGKYLKIQKTGVKIICVEPQKAQSFQVVLHKGRNSS